MRVKVETLAPLPHVKAWFSANAIPTILDLKTSLSTDLLPFRLQAISAHDLVLLLDDFELLDSSPIDVVRDGDLIVIKKSSVSAHNKRKTPSQDAISPARKRLKTGTQTMAKAPQHIRKPSPSSSESSSDSSSESDSTSSDSDSDSDSSSSSSSSSSASTSSGASSVNTKQRKRQVAAKKVATIGTAPPVPPGFGKPSTHSRNIRRRRKKMYERIAATAEPASVNEIPLGTRARTLETPTIVSSASPASEPSRGKGKQKAQDWANSAEQPQFLMASLQNKNKRRGFKDALTRGVPAKIIFGDASGADVASGSGAVHVDAEGDALMAEANLQEQPQPLAEERAARSRAPSRNQPRLVTPSEKQELGQIPANMFVTSVDVEEGMWPARRKNKKKKKAQVEEVWDGHEEEDSFAGGLPYDDESAAAMPVSEQVNGRAVAAATSSNGGAPDHTIVAAQWDTLRKIADRSQVSVGTTVAWKALGINMATLTPEYLLHIGRVSSTGENLVVEAYTEPGAAEVSFGGPVDEQEEAGGFMEPETFEWDSVLQGDWRLVASH